MPIFRKRSSINNANETPLIASGAHAVFTNVLQVFGALLTTVLIARLLGPARKGVFDLYFTLATLLNIFLQFSANAGITYAVASQPAKVRRLTSIVAAFAMLQGLLGAGIVVALSHLPHGQAFIPAQLGNLAPACVGTGVAALALFSMSRAILAGQRRFITANYGDMAKQAVGIGLVLIVFCTKSILPHASLTEVVIANFSALFFSSFYFLKSVDLTRDIEATSAQLKMIVGFAAPAYAANVMQYLNYRLDVFLVSYYRGPAAVGLYQIGVYIVLAINMIPQTIQSVLFPTISSRSGQAQRNAELIATSNRILTAFGVCFALFLAMTMPLIIPLLLGNAYRSSVAALLWLLPGSVAFITANVTAAYFSGIGRQSLNTVASAIGLVVTLVLDFILIPHFGFLGAACASSISYSATATFSSVMFSRITGVRCHNLYVLRASDMEFVRRIMRGTRQRLLLSIRPPVAVSGGSL
jgi:O-antigen/teichoic acid export membrane protein